MLDTPPRPAVGSGDSGDSWRRCPALRVWRGPGKGCHRAACRGQPGVPWVSRLTGVGGVQAPGEGFGAPEGLLHVPPGIGCPLGVGVSPPAAPQGRVPGRYLLLRGLTAASGGRFFTLHGVF